MPAANLDVGEYFKWFTAIAQIPHGSYNERELSNWLVRFAKERDLAFIQDALGNVCIKKMASPGMEKAPSVILQGHMDMVCVKEDGRAFDFFKDPIPLKVKGDFLTADGTTLGADNGIALAYILALLEAQNIPHPSLEAVITVEEEVGMAGAAGFDVTPLAGEFFINIDSEEEGVFCVSCAGGRRCTITLPLRTVPVADIEGCDKQAFFRIRLGGLAGGHSGVEIDKQRGNANRLMGRVLSTLAESCTVHLAAIAGGTASNVIPSESSAIIYFKGDVFLLHSKLAAFAATFRNELRAADGGDLVLTATPVKPQSFVFTKETFEKVVATLTLIPDGVVSMDLGVAGQRMVESSSNLGQVIMQDGAIVFDCLIRSNVGSRKEFLYSQIAAVAKLIGGEIKYFGDYSAWEYRPESFLREVFHKAYVSLVGKEAKIEGIHAGLECGLFYENFQALGRHVDCISFGPDITGAHTVRETVSISSVERTWRLLRKVLQDLGNVKK